MRSALGRNLLGGPLIGETFQSNKSDQEACGCNYKAYDQHEMGTFNIQKASADEAGENAAQSDGTVDISLAFDLV